MALKVKKVVGLNSNTWWAMQDHKRYISISLWVIKESKFDLKLNPNSVNGTWSLERTRKRGGNPRMIQVGRSKKERKKKVEGERNSGPYLRRRSRGSSCRLGKLELNLRMWQTIFFGWIICQYIHHSWDIEWTNITKMNFMSFNTYFKYNQMNPNITNIPKNITVLTFLLHFKILLNNYFYKIILNLFKIDHLNALQIWLVIRKKWYISFIICKWLNFIIYP